MRRCIVYTRFNGGVSVCYPSDEVLTWMSCGGIWNDRPRGFYDIQIERMIAAGHKPDAAQRFAKAVQFGGCTTAEALEIIRDRDCAHLGTAIELWDVSDVPSDRWYRDAWRRSHNGGPIGIDLSLAKPIQFKKARAAVERENKRRVHDLHSAGLLDIDMDAIRQSILMARDEIELRTIWPL